MKVGLEVHQQLATSKLFCACPCELSETIAGAFTRRLRPSRGESQEVDPAAAFQASRQLRYHYERGPSDCLVEMDEEPPRPLSEEALDVALTLALLLDARPVDEIEVMRKIVVDGSNTCGFQRTALVAVDGHLEVRGKRYSILSICLEEDAARKVREAEGEVVYRLDRLGIPLIEIATGPDIVSGAEARSVAEEIGALLRATGKVRRGIGTIREDLNVSTDGGHRIEIKGVQELRRIEEYVHREESRQKMLLSVRDELRRRRAPVPGSEPVDVSPSLEQAKSGPLSPASRKGGPVLALRLPGFGGLLGSRPGSDGRLGRELADQARSAGLRGLVHSDELPGYGLDAAAVGALQERLAVAEGDAFVLVADASTQKARAAIERIALRAAAALEGVPGETRDPLPDGTTRYSRPLPGRDRMYPETDVPPIPVAKARLDGLRAALPERPAASIERLATAGGLGRELAHQIVYGGFLESFEYLAGRGHGSALVARLLTQELPALPVTPGGDRYDPPLELLDELLGAAEAGRFAKEGLSAVLGALSAGSPTVSAAVEKAGLETLSSEALEGLIDRTVRAQLVLVRSRGPASFSALMGDVMNEVRGRRDGGEVAQKLRQAIDRALASTAP